MATPPTSGTVLQYLDNNMYPTDIIATNNITQAMSAAQNDVSKMAPIIKTATFNTVALQGLYNPFSYGAPAMAPPESVDVNGLRVVDAIWLPNTIAVADTDIFGIMPIWQNSGSFVPGIFDLSFSTPGDFAIYYSDMKIWRDRYGGSFRQVDNEIGGIIELIPTPTQVFPVTLIYAASRDFPFFDEFCQIAYYYMVESYICLMLARQFSQDDGLKIGQFQNAPGTGSFWSKEAIRLRELAQNEIGELGYSAFVSAVRS